MSSHLTPFLVAMTVIAMIVAHAALIFGSRKFNPLCVFACIFLLFTPFSGLETLPTLGVALKWIRGYALVMMVVLGLLSGRIGRLRTAGAIWLAFLGLYVVSATWSSQPHLGLSYKGLVLLAALGGLFLAYHIRDTKELTQVLRLLCAVSGLGVLVMFGMFFENPQAGIRWGRIALAGAGAGLFAHLAGPLFLICSHRALYDRSVGWRWIGGVNCALLAATILFTACRGEMAAVALGFLIQALPMSKRPLRTLAIVSLMLLLGFAALHYAGGLVATERIFLAGNTRERIWNIAVRTFEQAPLLGHGWVTFEEGLHVTYNLHSFYLQIAAETGLLGAALLMLCLLLLLFQGLKMFTVVRRNPTLTQFAYLPLSLIAATLFAAIVYNSLARASPPTLFMALSVGLIDRLPELTLRENGRMLLQRMFLAGRLRPLRG